MGVSRCMSEDSLAISLAFSGSLPTWPCCASKVLLLVGILLYDLVGVELLAQVFRQVLVVVALGQFEGVQALYCLRVQGHLLR
mmetsp:Transcript_18947/g.23481  ORF Transcript_18947/g.23481 Transcript_18947/m.23481 type:complete len:83 (-) Transcript_18947:810-1058(-)